MTDEEARRLRQDLDIALARIADLEEASNVLKQDVKNSVGWMAAVANAVVQAAYMLSLIIRRDKEDGDREKVQAAQDYIYKVRDDLEKMAREES